MGSKFCPMCISSGGSTSGSRKRRKGQRTSEESGGSDNDEDNFYRPTKEALKSKTSSISTSDPEQPFHVPSIFKPIRVDSPALFVHGSSSTVSEARRRSVGEGGEQPEITTSSEEEIGFRSKAVGTEDYDEEDDVDGGEGDNFPSKNDDIRKKNRGKFCEDGNDTGSQDDRSEERCRQKHVREKDGASHTAATPPEREQSKHFANKTDDISKPSEVSSSSFSPVTKRVVLGSASEQHQRSPIIPRARPRAGSDFRKMLVHKQAGLPRTSSMEGNDGSFAVEGNQQECAHSLSSQSSRSLSVNYDVHCPDSEARQPLLLSTSELDLVSDEEVDEEDTEKREIDGEHELERETQMPVSISVDSVPEREQHGEQNSDKGSESEEEQMLEVNEEKFVVPKIVTGNTCSLRVDLMGNTPGSSNRSTPAPPSLPDCPPPESENEEGSRSGSNTRCGYYSRIDRRSRSGSGVGGPEEFECKGGLSLADMSRIHYADSASSYCSSEVGDDVNEGDINNSGSGSEGSRVTHADSKSTIITVIAPNYSTSIDVDISSDDNGDNNRDDIRSDLHDERSSGELYSAAEADEESPARTFHTFGKSSTPKISASVNTDIVLTELSHAESAVDKEDIQMMMIARDRSDSTGELRSASTTPTPPKEAVCRTKEIRSTSLTVTLQTPRNTQTESNWDDKGEEEGKKKKLAESDPTLWRGATVGQMAALEGNTIPPMAAPIPVKDPNKDDHGDQHLEAEEEARVLLPEGFYYSELDLDLALQHKHMQESGKWHYQYHSTGHVPIPDDPTAPLVAERGEVEELENLLEEYEEDEEENTIEDLRPLITTTTIVGGEGVEGVDQSPQAHYRGVRTNVTGSWFSLSSSSSLEDYEEEELITVGGGDAEEDIQPARKNPARLTNLSFDPEKWSPESSPSLSILSYEEILSEQQRVQQDVQRVVESVKKQSFSDREGMDSGLALDLASQSNVQDAFVIAVEQQARERLEKLSALKKIKPVDMTKLSHQLSEAPSESGETSAELNGLIEAATGSPIYVTSASELNSSQSALHRTVASSAAAVTGASEESQEEEVGKSSPARSSPTSSTVTTRAVISSSGPDLSPGKRSSNNVTVVGVNSISGGSTTGGTCLPNGQYSSGATTGDRSAASSYGEPVLPAKKSISKESVNGSRKSGSRESITGSRESVQLEGAKPSPSRSRGSASKLASQSSSRESVIEASTSSQYANMINMVEWDNGPHREMAVDVPESFVPRNKTPPRYPPTNKTTTLNSNNNKTAGKSVVSDGVGVRGNGTATLPGQNGAAGKPVPPPRIGDKEQGVYGVNNNTTQVPHVTPRTVVGQQAKTASTTPSRDEAERIRKYQEELKKRREQEEKHAKEEEFLRTSLRGSKKLQALESVREDGRSYPTGEPKGFVNQAYDLDGDRLSHPSHDVTLQKPVGLPELVESLQRVQQALKKHGVQLDEHLSAVGTLMQTPEFQQVLAVHNKVQDVWCFNAPPTPVTAHAQQLNQECLESLYNCSSPASAELVEILSRIDMDGVLHAHDKIAERERLLMTAESPLNVGEPVDPVITSSSTPAPLPAVPAAPVVSGSHMKSAPRPAFVPEPQPDDHIKVVRIEKTQDPLGATVRNDADAVVIGRIVKGGAAERSGLLHEGDEILEVNGVEMRGKSVNEVCDILSRMTGTLTFLIVPTQVSQPLQQRRDILVHVRAHFDYDPEDDIYIPCRELGVAFAKGDVLHVINQEDCNWWQAHREGEEDQQLAGLIPSKSFQEQREAVKQTLLGETETREKTKKGTLLCAKTHKKKKKKIPYSSAFNDEFDAEEIPTYEEVALYYPRTSFKRPVVLIGPPNIGRHELRQRLMQESDRFAAAVPHTSRSRKDGEVDGQDYHFISRAQFESDILSRKFVEHGEFEKAYYGTSLDAIRSVVNASKICVLNLHPQSLKILRSSDLKPYIVFIAPPPLERLKQMRIARGEAYKEDELIDIIEKAREMEEKYGHYFDLVIVNNDIERTYHELVQRINYIEREPQWVPAFWLKQ